MKKLLIIVVILILLAVVAVFAVRHFAVGYLTPDFVSRNIESRWNCRADVGAVDIKLGKSTVIELSNVVIGPRDQFANDGTPLADRTPMAQSIIRVASASLSAQPGDLLKRHLQVDHLVISNAEIDAEVGEDGTANVDSLFQPPGGAGATSPVPPIAEEEELTISGAAEPVVVDPANDEFVASDMVISAGAALVELRDSRLSILLRKSGAKVSLENLQVSVKDIDIDPSQLMGHNSANFELGGTLAIDGDNEGQPTRYVELKVSGTGQISPFNSETGIIEPAWSSTVVFHQGSRFETFPLIEKLQAKLADIDAGGVDLSEIQLRGELQADAGTRLAHRQGRFTLEQPLALSLPDTNVAFEAGSWADTASNTHEIKGVVTASDELTAKISAQVDAYLAEKTGGLVSGDLSKQILGMAMKDGRIALEFVSSGDLGKPKVDVVTPFGKIGDIKNTLDGLKNAFKGLFGK